MSNSNKIATFSSGLINQNLLKKNVSEVEDVSKIWNTDRIEDFIKLMNRGKDYGITSPFFENKIGLRKGNIVFEYTKTELDEWYKCSQDIHYFAENYCQIKNDDGLYNNFRLRDYQTEFFDFYKNGDNVVYLASRQIGKCVTPYTRIDIIWNGEEINDIPIIKLYKMLFPNECSGILFMLKSVLWKFYNFLNKN